MGNQFFIKGSQPLELNSPKLEWRWQFWLSVIPFLLGIILLIYPQLTDVAYYQEYSTLRNAIAIVSLLSPIILPLALWFIKSIIITVKRANNYPRLYRHDIKARGELAESKKLISELLNYVNEENIFEIKKAAFINNNLYITLQKKDNPLLSIGDKVLVMHMVDRFPMGLFNVTEIRNNIYYTIGNDKIDPLWLGYVKTQGEVEVLPHVSAMYIHK